MRTPSLAGDGAGSGQVGKGGRVDTTLSPWPQPKPPPDFDHVRYPILATHWFGIVAAKRARAHGPAATDLPSIGAIAILAAGRQTGVATDGR